MIPGELDAMTEGEFRHSVAGSLNRIEVALNGDGSEANPGLSGYVHHLCSRIDYIEGPIVKKTVMPRIQALEKSQGEHAAEQKGRNSGREIFLSLLAGAGVVFGVMQAL